MPQIFKTSLCCLALTTFGLLGASAASAASPAWWVEGKSLTAGATKTLSESTEVTTPFQIKGGSFGVECTGIKLPTSFIEGEKSGLATISFEGCKDLTQKACKVAAFKTNPLTLKLEGPAKGYKLKFSPVGKTVATIEVSGSGCSPLSIELVGTMACNYPEVEAEGLKHKLEFTAESGSELKAFGVEAKFSGLDVFWLTPEVKWSVK